ncbi:uncharacterized protein LOC116612019 isoform X2 [Nematostella vectensis]|uniref:uncharacterized protein LOC116612019 isoform X1 n=1 Tax=Nematostella vectensis TaxID=45351 RepID=UPI0020776774|nr:uncharacterized protein LOC116612019 isoform X1 [Nematostella vectensis]XP_032228527.2 uncharacterized protein LOC116612019 isoform X1 [Nematostella vectensis]XP_032228528.2 uncharacterized protein LOC116612019 isoform X1 [Nematostella vectensis]XP_032228529.2 uncharacterized protein LOC116612019 isoform X2 [Nematostella vectensis]
METEVRETAMPTMPANITNKLQRWVRRASSVMEREKTSRPTTEQQNSITRKGIAVEAKITPVHGRSRSSPVSMDFVEQPRRKLSLISFQKNKPTNDGMGLDMSVQSGSLDDLSSVLNSNLRKKCSQSANSLSDVSWNGEMESPRRVRRTSSEDTPESYGSYDSSELDFNSNENKDRTRNKNKQSKGNKPFQEESRPRGTDVTSKDVHSRLDKWVDRSSKFLRVKQDSFDSTSSIASCSSDGEYGSPVFCYENHRPAPKEARELKELQTALRELVTNCGTVPKSKKTQHRKTKNSNITRKRSCSLQESPDLWKRLNRQAAKNEYEENELKRIVSEGNICPNEHGSFQGSAFGSMGDYADGKTRDEGIRNYNESIPNNGHKSQNSRQRRINEEEKVFATQTLDVSSRPLGQVAAIRDEEEADDDKIGMENESVEKKKSPEAKQTKPSSPLLSGRLETKEEERNLKRGMRACLDFNDADLSAFAAECIKTAAKKKMSKDKKADEAENEHSRDGLDGRSSLEREGKVESKWSSQSSILTNSSEEKTNNDKLELSDEDYKLMRASLEEEFSSENKESRKKAMSTESLDVMTSFEDGAVLVEAESPKDFEDNEEYQNLEQKESSGLRKFPSMPLFYVPKEEYDSSVKRNKSMRKSIWQKIKKHSPSTENISKLGRPKRTATPQKLDPFYHAEPYMDDLPPVVRPKAHSTSGIRTVKVNNNTSDIKTAKVNDSQSEATTARVIDSAQVAQSRDDMGNTKSNPVTMRPALETRRSVPLWKTSIRGNAKGDKEVVYTEPVQLVQPQGMVEELI